MTRTTDWDAVLTSSPVNTDAALTRDGRGKGWVPEVRQSLGHVRSHAPLPMKPAITGVDLTGFRCGKLTVVGLADMPERNAKRPAAWVVRCVCGYYETRTAKALRSPEYAAKAACNECTYLRELKAGRVVRPTVAERTKSKGTAPSQTREDQPK